MLSSLHQRAGIPYRKTLIILGLIMLTGVIFPEVASPQTGGLKINDFSAIVTKVQEASTSSQSIVRAIIPVVFILSALFVIWAIARNDPHKEQYAIGWAIALVFYFIVTAVV